MALSVQVAELTDGQGGSFLAPMHQRILPEIDLSLQLLRSLPGCRRGPLGVAANGVAAFATAYAIVDDEGFRSGCRCTNTEAFEVAVVNDLVAVRGNEQLLNKRLCYPLSHVHCVRIVSAHICVSVNHVWL